ARRGHQLVFGGGATGMMGAVVRGVTEEGGQSTGIAPRFFDREGVLYPGCSQMIFTDTMRQRKEQMEKLSDGFIVTPGGIGTLEEFFEMLTLKQLGQHDKPIAILNTAGCFDALGALLEGLVEDGFMDAGCLGLYYMTDDAEELLSYMEAVQAGTPQAAAQQKGPEL
ncbi:MAG: TIGR00730 family Rossman fold protein, partial [Anaerovoracaceae bacterium]